MTNKRQTSHRQKYIKALSEKAEAQAWLDMITGKNIPKDYTPDVLDPEDILEPLDVMNGDWYCSGLK